jgi:hypothetical protein
MFIRMFLSLSPILSPSKVLTFPPELLCMKDEELLCYLSKKTPCPGIRQTKYNKVLLSNTTDRFTPIGSLACKYWYLPASLYGVMSHNTVTTWNLILHIPRILHQEIKNFHKNWSVIRCRPDYTLGSGSPTRGPRPHL